MEVAPTPKRTDSGRWQVRWRDSTGRLRQRTFTRKSDANRWSAHVEYMRQMGELAVMDLGESRLDELAEQVRVRRWKQRERATYERYLRTWNLHVGPYLYKLPINRITGPVIEDWLLGLEANGVSSDSRRRALAVLRQILTRGVEWGYLRANPSIAVPMPKTSMRRRVVPLSPDQVENLARQMDRERDAMLIRVMGFAGPRPGEAFALTTDHIKRRTLLIEQAVAFGEIKATKTGATRSVELVPGLVRMLGQWIMREGIRGLLWPRFDGMPINESDYRNWTRRIFSPAAIAAGFVDHRNGRPVASITPYTLRHSYASLLIHDGRSPVEVAGQMGHSPTMALNTYGHIFADLDRSERFSAVSAIEQAIARAV